MKRYWFEMKNLFAAILLMFTASAASAEWPTLEYLKDIKQIEVILADEAVEACWTNLRESREYAEEKIRMAGGNLYQAGPKRWPDYYVLFVKVRSSRQANGLCYGYVQVFLTTGEVINGKNHNAIALETNTYFSNGANANNAVISTIQDFFGDS